MLTLKALHIIAMVAWFAGLFYLPRLFVYHALAQDKLSKDRFKIMEHKLFYIIMTPAAVLTIIFGIILFWYNRDYYLHATWMHYKLLLVIFLVVYHFLCGYYLNKFKFDVNQLTARFFRFFNEVPTLLLVLIVFLVVLKP